MKALLAAIVVILLGWGVFHFLAYGWHYQTSQGDHTGYITAVETTGVFWKTHTVYLKTNTTSTQEDSYCVTDPAVFDQLQQASVNVSHINVHFVDWFAKGFANCAGENGVITSIALLTN